MRTVLYLGKIYHQTVLLGSLGLYAKCENIHIVVIYFSVCFLIPQDKIIVQSSEFIWNNSLNLEPLLWSGICTHTTMNSCSLVRKIFVIPFYR